MKQVDIDYLERVERFIAASEILAQEIMKDYQTKAMLEFYKTLYALRDNNT